MNKQTLIDDYKQTIERLQKECTEKTDFNIKLMERVKELEEENETLKDRLIVTNAKQVDYAIKTKEKLKNVRGKLKIAKEALGKIISYDKCNRCDGIGYDLGCLYKDCEIYIANQALQKIKEVTNDNNINLN